MSHDEPFYPFLVGARMYLREVRLSDTDEAYYRWMNNPDVTRGLESRFFPNGVDDLREFVASARRTRDNLFLAIVLKDSHQHIGNIKLGPINWIHRTADIGLIIGEKRAWGQGYGSEAIALLTQHAFRQLNLWKVTASCYSTNEASARAFEKAGFEREGLRRAQFYADGVYVDQILLGLRRAEP